MAARGGTFWSFIAIAVALAAVFLRLGAWQLDRRAERRDMNRERAARLAEPLLSQSGAVDQPADRVFWRRVELSGVYDYDREVVLFGRARRGVPGVHVATPLRIADSLAVVVLRGWLPAADGISAELGSGRPEGGRPRWLQEEAVNGIALPFPPTESSVAIEQEVDGAEHLVMRVPELGRIDAATPYAIVGWYVLATDDPLTGTSLRSIPTPELEAGPHLAYAIQWFAFAAIAIIGALVFARRRTFVGSAPHA